MIKFYRKHHGESCGQDWDRVVALYRASIKSNYFNSPKPLILHAEDGAIDYELFPEGRLLAYELFLTLIFSSKGKISQLAEIFEVVGKALAQFHQSYELIGGGIFELDIVKEDAICDRKLNHIKTQLQESDFVYLHGDFGTGNIWIPKGESIPIIFDPIPSAFCPSPDTKRVSIYYDIGHMVFTLWCVYPLWVYKSIDWKTAKLFVSSFLRGYEKESKQQLDDSVVFYMAYRLQRAYIEKNEKKLSGLKGSIRRYLYSSRRLSLIKEINNG